jgi:UPF0271 protein
MFNNFFEVIRPGINTTYQDRGRFGVQYLGITSSGCMDYKSFLIVNSLLDNNHKEGVLEFAYQGPLLKLIKGKAKIAITGNVYFQIIYLNGKTIEGVCNRSYDLNEGDQIDILATIQSAYGYLGIKGGFQLNSFCNSVSTLTRAKIGPNKGSKIRNKDKVFFNTSNHIVKNKVLYNDHSNKNNIIRVLKGPQFHYFSNESIEDFISTKYKISSLTDRMGMRLEGKFLQNIVNTNIKSEGIIKGAIQVPEDGQPIILLNDHPTIGGYPKIANVISADYDQLIQKTPGKKILFKYISLAEAEEEFNLYQIGINHTLNSMEIIK